jgi:hypothetical protein
MAVDNLDGGKGAVFSQTGVRLPVLSGCAVEVLHLASAVDRPVCKRCGVRMMLARIAPDRPDFEVRSFECPKCDLVYSERVPTDPMVSSKGWLASELKPPS